MVYRCVPGPIRRRLEASSRLERVASSSLLHGFFYDARYYDSQLPWLEKSARTFTDSAELLGDVGSVVDVGCGQGQYLAAWARRGIAGWGIEYSREAVRRCHEQQLDVERADLRELDQLPWQGELVYSIEVAEHLPEQDADHFVELLTAASRRWVVLTAAAPGQTGMNHFNCQPADYWISRVESHGFKFCDQLTCDWKRRNAAASLPPWLCENLMVFERRAA